MQGAVCKEKETLPAFWVSGEEAEDAKRGDLPPEHIFKSRWLQACGSQVVETQFLPWPCPAPATSTDLSPPQDTAHWEGSGPFLQDLGPSLSPYPPAPQSWGYQEGEGLLAQASCSPTCSPSPCPVKCLRSQTTHGAVLPCPTGLLSLKKGDSNPTGRRPSEASVTLARQTGLLSPQSRRSLAL